MGKRACLTWLEKRAILYECKRQGIVGKEKIDQFLIWAAANMQLRVLPSYRTVERILKNEEEVLSWASSDGRKRKKGWSVKNIVVELELRVWVMQMWECGVFLTDIMIQEKARRLQYAFNLLVPRTKQTNLAFSNGWLHLFKKRNGFKCYKSHGEQADADHDGARAALPRLRQLTAQYALKDIYNADEFGLFYSAAPKSTIGKQPLPGRKMNKDRASFLLCTNVDGTDNYTPF